MSNSPLIRLENVTYSFSEGEPVFEEYSWQVKRAETWAVLGPSGCGKTTLLYLLAGLYHPQVGRVFFAGQELTRPRPRTGLIIQEYGLLPWATVRENAGLGTRIRGFYGPDGTHAPVQPEVAGPVEPWLARLDIMDQADKYPAQLSGGQRQRTAIARTLVLEPDTLLMDEPFSSLDAPTREGLQNLTLELQAERDLTLIVVTHNIEEAAYMGRNILMLNQPPNFEPNVIDNPGAGQPAYRGSGAYQDMCSRLRQMMGEEAARG